MMIVFAHVHVQPAHRAAFLAAMPAFLKATRAENGCAAYDFCESLDQPNHFVTLERWATRASFDGHMASPHLQGFLAEIGLCLASAPSIEAVETEAPERVA